MPSSPRVLVAPDSFKGTFSADEVAAAIARGLRESGALAETCPVADGGEGTMAILVGALGGRVVRTSTEDPLGRPLDAPLGLVGDGATAVVEMAAASGLGLVAPEERDAEAASTRGTGRQIAAAVHEHGARHVLVTVGGSATTDGGAGAIEAIERAGGLPDGVRLTCLCDVTVPFERAAEVFAPQKGADPAMVERLTARLHAFAATLPQDPRGVPRSGAAGGLSGGLHAHYGAELVDGAAFVLDALRFDARLADGVAAVVSGEGRLDAQTLHGKIVGAVAGRCTRAGVPLHAIVGSTALDDAAVAELALASVRCATDLTELEAAGRALGASLHPA